MHTMRYVLWLALTTRCAWHAQARAHVLLKAKEAELKAAREAGAAVGAHEAELAAAQAAATEAQAACTAVRPLTECSLSASVIVAVQLQRVKQRRTNVRRNTTSPICCLLCPC